MRNYIWFCQIELDRAPELLQRLRKQVWRRTPSSPDGGPLPRLTTINEEVLVSIYRREWINL
ncbi:MAG: hypothetical protein ACLVHV_17210, partial [Oscillospiraceae bacterium]